MKPPLCLDYPKRYTAAHIGSHWVPVNHLCPDSVDIDSRGFGTCSWGQESKVKTGRRTFNTFFSTIVFPICFFSWISWTWMPDLPYISPYFPPRLEQQLKAQEELKKTCSQQICGKCPSSLLVNLRGKLGKMGTMAMARILQQFVHFWIKHTGNQEKTWWKNRCSNTDLDASQNEQALWSPVRRWWWRRMSKSKTSSSWCCWGIWLLHIVAKRSILWCQPQCGYHPSDGDKLNHTRHQYLVWFLVSTSEKQQVGRGWLSWQFFGIGTTG